MSKPGGCHSSGAARFVADDRDLAVAMGAIGGVGLDAASISAELGEVLAGIRPGRLSDADITIFGSVGLPFQDLVVAWTAYQAAVAAGVGRPVRLFD